MSRKASPDHVGFLPALEGPLDGNPATVLEQFDLGPLGYVAEEHFFSGEARRFTAVGELGTDGRWSAEAGAVASFRSRMLVRRPADPARFSGTVVVEWLNVSSGTDVGPGWTQMRRELIRSGAVFVGVSAQRAGIEGGGVAPGLHLKRADPQRYASLEHPGDAFSFDIFSSAVRLIRSRPERFGGRAADCVLATGDSQSAMFLVTYLNAVDPLARLIDGCSLHGRMPRGAPLDAEVWGANERLDLKNYARDITYGHRIRDDVRIPVLIVQSETDQIVLNAIQARQPDSERVRTWEVAGAAHADSYAIAASHFDNGMLPPALLAKLLTPTTAPSGMPVARPINAGPQKHYILQAGLHRLERWVRDGTPPPVAPPLVTDADCKLRRDKTGIAEGGVRSPWVDVPVCILSGLGQQGEGFGMLFGSTEPLPIEELRARYPGGRAEYADAFARATDRAVAAGFLLEADADEIKGVGVATWPFWPRA